MIVQHRGVVHDEQRRDAVLHVQLVTCRVA